jgi:NADPH:quinone reductase-like Zn-dependent oxidoreductase
VKAVVIHAPGAPEQLVLAEMPEPIPGPSEVLVDVAFAGCNWADTQIRTHLSARANLSARAGFGDFWKGSEGRTGRQWSENRRSRRGLS